MKKLFLFVSLIIFTISVLVYNYGMENIYIGLADKARRPKQKEFWYEKAISCLEKGSKKNKKLHCLYNIYGTFLFKTKQLTKSIEVFHQTIDCSEPQSLESAYANLNIAWMKMIQKQYVEAEERTLDALKVIETNLQQYNATASQKDQFDFELLKSSTWTHQNSRVILDAVIRKKIDENLDYERKWNILLALQVIQEINEKTFEAQKDIIQYSNNIFGSDTLYRNFAYWHEANSEWNKAVKCYSTLLSRKQTKEVEADAFLGRGICHTRLNKFEEAESDYLNSQKIYKELNDKKHQLELVNNLSCLYFYKGQSKLAVQYALEALDQIKDSDSASLKFSIYDSLACAYELDGQLDLAIENFNHSISFWEDSGQTPRTMSNRLMSLGNVYFKHNDVNKARQYWKEALKYLDAGIDEELVDKLKGNLNLSLAPVEIPRAQQYKK